MFHLPTTTRTWRIRGTIVAIVVLFCVSATTWELRQLRQQARRASVANDAKDLMNMSERYARDHGGQLPPLDPRPGRLVFDPDQMYPDYCSNAGWLAADFDPYVPDAVRAQSKYKGRWGKEQFDDFSFYYLGFAILSPTEGEAFVDAYKTAAASGFNPGQGLPARPGRGTFGKDEFLRLHLNLERILSPTPSGALATTLLARVPTFVQRPEHVDGYSGGIVAYLDGHVEYVDYPGRFPMTESFIEGLRSLDEIEQSTE